MQSQRCGSPNKVLTNAQQEFNESWVLNKKVGHHLRLKLW